MWSDIQPDLLASKNTDFLGPSLMLTLGNGLPMCHLTVHLLVTSLVAGLKSLN